LIQLPALKRAIPGLFLVMALVLLPTACSGGEEKTPPTAEPSSNGEESKTQTTAQPSIFTFENEALSFDYGTEWRVSRRTDDSIVLTHKERTGEVLLSAQWVEGKASKATDVTQLFRNQLDLLATEVQRLEDIKIDNIDAERYASLVSRDGEGSVVTLHVLFNSGKTFYLVTFSARPDDFVAYTDSANQVINTIRVP